MHSDFSLNRDPNRDKNLCDSTSDGTDQYQNDSSNLLYSISRAASIDSDCCRLRNPFKYHEEVLSLQPIYDDPTY